ncbi:MAG: PhnD/SsuA/transferrin family substrate-binding protein [Pseudomonadota bacterium]
MTASLPMYDTTSMAAANDRFWQLISSELGEGPTRLSRTADPWQSWTDPDLLLSQTCSLPYRLGLHSEVALVGTPDYGLKGCPPGFYRSTIVVRSDEQRHGLAEYEGARFARNDQRSQSGWAAIVQHLQDEGLNSQIFSDIVSTGSHAASARAVLDQEADLAALDAVSWEIIRRENPGARRGLRVLACTRPTPGLPFITAGTRDPCPIFDAVARAIQKLAANDRNKLMLRGIVRIPAERYLSLPMPDASAVLSN